MKKFFVIFTLFTMFLAVSCGGPVKFEDSQEGQTQTDEPKERGALGGKCFQNGTCNSGLICDEESNTCMKEPEEPTDTGTPEPTDTGTTEPTDTGTTESTDTGTTEPADTGTPEPTDTGTTEPDEDSGDTAPDEGDTAEPTDTGEPEPDEDQEEPVPVNPCDSDPCEGVLHASGSCAVVEGGYVCGCLEHYSWTGSVCKADSRVADCTGLPANATWNTAESISQTWDGEDWYPPETGMYNTNPSSSECRFKCVSEDYEWNGSTCQSNSSGGSKSLGEICTNQTTCYNASSSMTCPSSSSADFYGQDAQYANKCTAQSFSSTSNVVVDNNTGLTWEKSPSSSTYTWANRATHCNELNSSNYGGKSNWRVPNPLEFMTIVDNSTYNPATNSNFTNMPTRLSDYLWTSKEYGGDTSLARAFNPYYGWYSYGNSKTDNSYKVLCVSGNELAAATSSDFTTQTISGKVVVTDSKTGLMWQKEYETGKTWQQALKYCEDSTYAGYSDWRLPNKNELASLLDPGKSGAPYSNFPDMPSNYFWSSSTFVYNTTENAWYVYFNYGGVSNGGKTNNGHDVRCVR